MGDSVEVRFQLAAFNDHHQFDSSREEFIASVILASSVKDLEVVFGQQGEPARNSSMGVFHIEYLFERLMVGVQLESARDQITAGFL